MYFRYFLITDILLTVGIFALEVLKNPLSAILIIALQFSITCAAVYLAQTVIAQKKFFYYTLAAAFAIRSILDSVEFISSHTFLPNFQKPELYIAFTIPMLLLLVSIIYYFAATIMRYDRKQLLVDSYKVTVVIVTCLGATTLDVHQTTNIFRNGISPFTAAFALHSITTCLIIIISLIILFSRRIRRNAFAYIGLVLFYLLVASRHIFLTYRINDAFDFNPKIIEHMLVLGCIILSFTLQYQRKLQVEKKFTPFTPGVDQPENIGNNIHPVLFLVAISTVIWKVDLIPTPLFLMLMFVLFILQRMDMLVQQSYAINSQLKKELTIDSLTNLHNRVDFMAELTSRIDEKKPFTLFFANLIRFKIINDIHGSEAGDSVLKEMGLRLTQLQKQLTDVTVFRSGGDEFAVLFNNCNQKAIEELAQQIKTTVERTFTIEQLDLSITARIGAAQYPRDTKNSQKLLRYADNAMRKNRLEDTCYTIHVPTFAAELERKSQLERKLQQSGITENFSLFYQPKINIADKKLYEMEALIRWFDEENGPVSPAEFIPMAENMGKIDEISQWVFRTAFTQIREWNEKYGTNHTVNVNVSPLTIHNKMFVSWFMDILEETAVKPEWIGIEITEHSAMSSPLYMRKILSAISGIGIKISIDDFGTGYSSLSYLKRFDIDELKIAKELIDNIEKGCDDYKIVNAIIRMAKELSLQTVAEGVEVPEQLAILEKLGCDTIQGYLFDKPLPPNELEERYFTQ